MVGEVHPRASSINKYARNFWIIMTYPMVYGLNIVGAIFGVIYIYGDTYIYMKYMPHMV
jgi:hypothetical protein